MASTVTASTMTVTISESITLNGKNQGGTQTLSIPSIATVSRRIIDVPASEVEIIAMSTAVAAGTFIESDVLYIRITNLDDTNHVTLTFKDEDDTEVALLLDKGQSFIYNGDLSGGVVNTMHAGGSALTVSLNDLVNVTDTGLTDEEKATAATADFEACVAEQMAAIVAAKAELPFKVNSPDWLFHSLRHTWTSIAYSTKEDTGAITRTLGHSDEGFSRRKYAHSIDGEAVKVTDAVSKKLGVI